MSEIRKIQLSRMCSAMGRNGTSKQVGIHLMLTYDKKLCIEPTNTKGGITNCTVQCPIEDVPDLIEALQWYVDTTTDPTQKADSDYESYRQDGF